MKTCNKIKQTCASKNYAPCIIYESTVNTNSSLESESCNTIEEVAEDIYSQLEDINLSALGESCLTYVQEDGRLKVKNVLLKYEQEICTLKEQIEELTIKNICNIDITNCNLNFYDLVDACGDQPSTLAQVLQLLLDQTQTP